MPDHTSKTPSGASSTSTTRTTRSSTIPPHTQSQSRPKHRSKHRPHASHSQHATHAHNHSHNSQSPSQSSLSALNLSPLSPLGELLNPVRRNVAEGFSGVTGWVERGFERDKERERTGDAGEGAGDADVERKDRVQRKEVSAAEAERARKRKAAAEKALTEQYNALAKQTLVQHTALDESRGNMLHELPQVESTLSSLRTLLANTSTLLQTLTRETIPELTQEANTQVNTLESTISQMENERVADLQTRVGRARQRSTELGERMAEVRKKIERSEQKEKEEEARRRRRVGIVWGALGTVVLIFVIMTIVGMVSEDVGLEGSQEPNWTEVVIGRERNESAGINTSVGKIEGILRDMQKEDVAMSDTSVVTEEENLEDDGLLSRMFDEL